MSERCSFSVAALGFEEHERKLLRNVLQISEHRTPAFTPYVTGTRLLPQIVVVNGDKPEALAGWEALQRKHAGSAMSAVLLSRQPPAGNPKYWLSRPILATRLFALLERVVTEEHGFSPALAIHPDDELLLLSADDVPHAKPLPQASVQRAPAEPAGKDVVALVVDDSLPVRIQMRSALEGIAKHVDFAESGEEALGLIETTRYDVVFLDVILPGMDGYEVCRRVRKSARNVKSPVVMLTSNSSPADRIKGKLAGCDTYLIKPVRQGVFEEVLREFLQAPATT